MLLIAVTDTTTGSVVDVSVAAVTDDNGVRSSLAENASHFSRSAVGSVGPRSRRYRGVVRKGWCCVMAV